MDSVAKSQQRARMKQGVLTETSKSDTKSVLVMKRSTALGQECQEGLIRPHPYAEEYDFTEIVYLPHTFLALGFLVLILLFVLYVKTGSIFGSVTTYQAFIFPSIVFIVFCVVHLPDSYLVRPHPVLWRLILAVAILYALLLSYLSCISLKDVKGVLLNLDPNLAQPVIYKQHTIDCRFSTESDPYHWLTLISDEFIIAHSLGYWVKALMVRDAGVVLISSFIFEVLEYTFQHWMENFKECWWDHVIADFIVCNGGGMILGLLTLRWLKVREYNWVSLKQIPSLPGKAKRIALQFTPRDWNPHRWALFYSPHRALCTLLLVLIMQWQEFNLFALKFILDIPTTHFITLTRLAIFTALSFPAIREYYEYCFTPEEKGFDHIDKRSIEPNDSLTKLSKTKCTPRKLRHRLGMSAWITLLSLSLESYIICKFSHEGNVFQAPFPPYISIPWGVTIFLWILWFIVRYAGYSAEKRPVERQSYARRLTSWAILVSSFIPLVALCLMAADDIQFGREVFLKAISF